MEKRSGLKDLSFSLTSAAVPHDHLVYSSKGRWPQLIYSMDMYLEKGYTLQQVTASDRATIHTPE